MSIETVDPFDDARLGEAHAVTLTDATESYAAPWTWHEYSVAARTPDPWTTKHILLARGADGTATAVSSVEIPQRDNTGMVWADLALIPGDAADRAAGDLLGHIKGLAREYGRSTVLVDTEWPADQRTGRKPRLLAPAGFELALPYAHRVLDLPVDTGAVEKLAVEAASHHRDHRLVTWSGPCPAEWVGEYARLRSRILIEAPGGEVGFEAEAFDTERVRREEDELAAQQRTMYTVAAVRADGGLAGHSQLVVAGTDDRNAFQWDTLVLSADRGHRLGIALKARNLIEASDALSTRTSLHTWNAVDNAHMVGVNQQLGFRLVEYSGEFKCTL